jgi:hypothetical protein
LHNPQQQDSWRLLLLLLLGQGQVGYCRLLLMLLAEWQYLTRK